jgi:hypothetical protein
MTMPQLERKCGRGTALKTNSWNLRTFKIVPWKIIFHILSLSPTPSTKTAERHSYYIVTRVSLTMLQAMAIFGFISMVSEHWLPCQRLHQDAKKRFIAHRRPENGRAAQHDIPDGSLEEETCKWLNSESQKASRTGWVAYNSDNHQYRCFEYII